MRIMIRCISNECQRIYRIRRSISRKLYVMMMTYGQTITAFSQKMNHQKVCLCVDVWFPASQREFQTLQKTALHAVWDHR